MAHGGRRPLPPPRGGRRGARRAAPAAAAALIVGSGNLLQHRVHGAYEGHCAVATA
jgi:hypothetical protein